MRALRDPQRPERPNVPPLRHRPRCRVRRRRRRLARSRGALQRPAAGPRPALPGAPDPRRHRLPHPGARDRPRRRPHRDDRSAHLAGGAQRHRVRGARRGRPAPLPPPGRRRRVRRRVPRPFAPWQARRGLLRSRPGDARPHRRVRKRVPGGERVGRARREGLRSGRRHDGAWRHHVVRRPGLERSRAAERPDPRARLAGHDGGYAEHRHHDRAVGRPAEPHGSDALRASRHGGRDPRSRQRQGELGLRARRAGSGAEDHRGSPRDPDQQLCAHQLFGVHRDRRFGRRGPRRCETADPRRGVPDAGLRRRAAERPARAAAHARGHRAEVRALAPRQQ